MKTQFTLLAVFITLSSLARAQEPAPDCDDLVWSAQVLAANPDIRLACKGVYVRGDDLFAKVTIELMRVRGNRISFRPQHSDGSLGSPRSMVVSNRFRANIGGRTYRLSELLPGQELNVYIPEDRFALAVHDGSFDGDEELIAIEEAEVVTMPKTASPLYALLGASLGLLGMGALLSFRRRHSGHRNP